MKNSKNVYELLNCTEFNIDDYDKVDLSDIEKKKLKGIIRRNIKKKHDFSKLATIAAVLVLTFGVLSQTNIGREVYASAHSKLSEFSYSISKGLGIKRNIEPYSNVINQIVEDNGVEIKLTDVIIDKDELIFTSLINIGKTIETSRLDYKIFINGKKLNNYGATGLSYAIDENNGIYYHAYSVDAKGIETKENIDIKIVLYNLHYYHDSDENEIKGEWVFEFEANGTELMKDTLALPLEYEFFIDNEKYSLEEFRYNPVNQKILGKVTGKSDDTYIIDLRGYDNLGNEVVFYMSSKSDKEIVLKYEDINRDLSEDISSITLTPYATILPKASGKMSNDYIQVGEEFTIYLDR